LEQKFKHEFLFNGTPQTFNPNLVLYSPFTTQEVADFFRLGLAFDVLIVLTNENGKAQDLINRVQKTFFKGLAKISFKIVPSLEQLTTENSDSFFGFSLWGTKSISELPLIIHSLRYQDSEKLSIYFLFGNEEKGLPLFVRYKIPIFHIGRQASEPLRAAQAAAYVLGTLYSL
jgi:tRNA(Leu) C34 or U34 (ribose-2'-O)-methylase TrmL